ncbi:PREDICTED: alpha/beta-gliadin-like [Bactrocera latifrons]|nr:PREDICTED: alpha/beta-gliadin-like [Bactrocera latifrons]
MKMFHKTAILLLVLAVAFTHAEPPRFRQRNSRLQQRRPFFARQESVPSAPEEPEPAPYPSADELKPEDPFQAEEELEPELVYGPPDPTYGPPLPATDPLPVVDAPAEFAPNPEAEEFARLTVARPSRLQQRSQQQTTQFHIVQQSQRLQQRKPQQKAIIRQIVNTPQQKATIRQVVSTQRLVAKPAPAATVVVAAPAVASAPANAPSNVVISSERLVQVEPAPLFSASLGTPLGESYVTINSPFALTSQYQSW